jgi:hypothetical protein
VSGVDDFQDSVRAEATAGVLYEHNRSRQDRSIWYVSPGRKNTADENTPQRLKYHPFKINATLQIPSSAQQILIITPATLKKPSGRQLLNVVYDSPRAMLRMPRVKTGGKCRTSSAGT